jgi:hypothetical protein
MTDGCCPIGEICSGGGGGTRTVNLPAATRTPTSSVKTQKPTATVIVQPDVPDAAARPKTLDGSSIFGGLVLAVGYLFF